MKHLLKYCCWISYTCIVLVQINFCKAQKIDSAILIANVQEHLKELSESNEFSGVILIAKDGKPLLRKAYGLASRSFNIPNNEDTKFNIASMGKMFTALAIMQLVQKEKLGLQDKVGKYLPQYPNKAVADSVTIHQLLTHTGGLGNFFTEEFRKTSKEQFKEVKDYLPVFVNQPLLFQPGSKHSYSNSGFLVLGLIIEAVTGQNYFDYVKKNIFEPAGMINTDSYDVDHPVPNLAEGYTRSREKPGQWMNNLFLHVVKGGPSGGSYSTANDLLNFSNALLNYKLLSKVNTEILTSGKVDVGPNFKYAYGFEDYFENGHRIIGHTGGFTGIRAHMFIYKDLGYTVIVMSNMDSEGYADLSLFVKKQLIGSTPAIENYFLTRKVIKLTFDSGYTAGVNELKNKGSRELVVHKVNGFGYQLLRENKFDKAIDIFKLNVFAFPTSANAYNSLGEAYMKKGEKKLAIESYEKSLLLNKNNNQIEEKKGLDEDGKKMLELLKK